MIIWQGSTESNSNVFDCDFECNSMLQSHLMWCDVLRYLWLISQWCHINGWLSAVAASACTNMWYDVLFCHVTWCDMTWHYYFNCMTLSTMSTIKQRHITDSIYQYLPIHWQDGHSALYYASQNGQVEVVKLLLDRGADIEAADNVS